MYITHEQRFTEPHILYTDTDDIFVVYLGADGQAYIATKTSMFETNIDRFTGEFRGISLIEIAAGMRFMIDNVEVSRTTFEKVRDLLQRHSIQTYGTRADCCYFDEVFDDFSKWCNNTWMNSSKKEIDDMINHTHKKIMEEYSKAVDNHFMIRPHIVDYKYIAENGVTIIKWSDNTSTTVTCDPKTADQYTGFVTAIAKKAFGNGGKMLSEWDRLVIKPIEDAKKAEEKAKIEAEKKAKEDKIHAEAKAKRDAKKAKRKKKREIEKLAKQIADEYYAQELTEEAEKLAIKKYGVPKSYLDDYDCGYDNCNCKEFDVMDDDNITD